MMHKHESMGGLFGLIFAGRLRAFGLVIAPLTFETAEVD
tara:strand:+ start:465 stop:581 length:117 start_codon:yes stop_codon:yes gene_type:complete